MTAVKPESSHPVSLGGNDHALTLMGVLMRSARHTLAREDWNGLRTSHFRLLSQVPSDGATITELADALSMTKQATGQFVATLTESGYLEVQRHPDDGRVRVVVLTPRGKRTVRVLNNRIARLERDWAHVVGSEDYEEFRRVLAGLAIGLRSRERSRP